MNYFEVLYKNCFDEKKRAIIATKHDTPETATLDFNFNWNGNSLLEWLPTDQYHYARNIYRFYF